MDVVEIALARDALVAAYRNGITHWDTADAYGNGHAEQLIGEVFGEVPRKALVAQLIDRARKPTRLP